MATARATLGIHEQKVEKSLRQDATQDQNGNYNKSDYQETVSWETLDFN